jgi:hypothetical protein
VPAQVPVASQVPDAVSVEPVQPPASQITPAPKRAQAPVPSQTPVRPQTAAVSVGQRWPGLVPAADGRQVPSAPGDTQLKQAPLQAVSQQTPSAQNSDAHSLAVPHGSPICLTGRSSLPPEVSPITTTSPVIGTSSGASLGPASGVRLSPAPPQPASASMNVAITGNKPFPPTRAHPGARSVGWEATGIDEPFSNERFLRRARTGSVFFNPRTGATR